MQLLCLCFFIIGLNFQTISVKQELIDVHKNNPILILITLYRVFCDYKLLETVRYIYQ